MIVLSVGISVLAGIIFWVAVQKRILLIQKRLEESFKALSFDVMEKSQKSFLELAKSSFERYQEGAKADLEARQKGIETLLTPLSLAVQKLDTQQRELERQREGAYAALSKQIEGMVGSEKALREQTAQLAMALRSPSVRGSWGQLHLKRVVELAGLLSQCDFFEQQSFEEDGKILRPDLVVRLPGGRHLVVDAKTPLDAYLQASESSDEDFKRQKLQDHAAHLRRHIRDLSLKEYWKQLSLTPEYVILFLPAEAFFSAALQVDPSLIELGAHQNVIVATPTTLIAILRAVAYSWKQEGLSQSAQEIAKWGGELYERVGILCDHWSKLGKHLGTAVDAYNQSITSLQTRILVTARKLKESGHFSKELSEPQQIEKLVKESI